MQDAGEYDQLYMHGLQNRGIRYYYYLDAGLNVLNQFRNLGLGIIALYIALKLENPLFLVAMFVPSVIALTMLGYYQTHTVSKVREWVAMRFSSHYGIRQFNYQQGQYDLLKEIRDALKNKV